MGLPGTHHGVAGARLSRAFLAHEAAIDGTGSTGRSGIDQQFTFGDPSSLPREPLDYITRQAQGDFVVMDQRDGDLWAEAGMVTTPADWSLDFDIGMTFKEWHGPVPLGARDRRVRQGAEVSAESAARPAGAASQLDHDGAIRGSTPRRRTIRSGDRTGPPSRRQNAGDLVHLRVEMQGLWRLPRSNAVLFGIRCYLISVRELVDHSQVGAARASGAQRPASRTRRLQGAHPLSRHGGRVAGALRRRLAHHARSARNDAST